MLSRANNTGWAREADFFLKYEIIYMCAVCITVVFLFCLTVAVYMILSWHLSAFVFRYVCYRFEVTFRVDVVAVGFHIYYLTEPTFFRFNLHSDDRTGLGGMNTKMMLRDYLEWTKNETTWIIRMETKVDGTAGEREIGKIIFDPRSGERQQRQKFEYLTNKK